ncbi:MAG: DUF3604 domain-containing protein, partial [Deltaproteobacteria bacterium]
MTRRNAFFSCHPVDLFARCFLAFAFPAALISCDNSTDSDPCPGAASAEECVVAPDPCPDRNPLRNLYVGELHIHSSLSFDAEFAGVIAEPRDA